MTIRVGNSPGGAGPWVATLLAAAVAISVEAQEPALRVDRLSIEDGLSHSAVWSIHQDRLGFLWFASQEGLNRYDGHGFQVFHHDPDDPESLADDDLLYVYVDRGDGLWIGTRGGGLDRYHRAENRFEHFRHDPDDPASLSHDVVWTILEDRTGALWVGTEDGLNRRRPPEAGFTRYQDRGGSPRSLPGRRVKALFEDRDGGLWVGTNSGIFRYDRDADRFIHYPHSPAAHRLGFDSAIAFAEDEEGLLWVGSDVGLARLDRRTGELEAWVHDDDDPRSLPGGAIFSLHVDRGGGLWVGSFTEGLARYDRATRTFMRYRSRPGDPESLNNDTILSMYQDRSGLLWFGTRLGVNKYNPNRDVFALYRHRENPGGPASGGPTSSNVIRGVAEDRDGIVWVSTDQGLRVLDAGGGTFREAPLPAPGAKILAVGALSILYVDRADFLWVGMWTGGLVGLGPGRRELVHYRHDPQDPESLLNDQVRAVLEDASGRLWVGTFQGLCRLDRDRGRFVRYPQGADEPAGLGHEPFSVILEDHAGALWFGSYTEGLYRLDPAGRFERFRHDPRDPGSLSSDKVRSLYEDRHHVLWVGTAGGGLNRIDPARERIRRYTEEDGLGNNTVVGILEDDEGHLWLGTRGLTHFDPAAETFRNFDTSDGLQGNIFTQSAAFRDSRGVMYFGGFNGLNAFVPDAVPPQTGEPHVVVTRFQLFNVEPPLARLDPSSPLERSILDTREIVLSHRDDVFSFEFAALDFTNPERHRFAYRLESFDRDWIETDSARRFAQYSNLDPGDYTFRVRAMGRSGRWTEGETPIRVVVEPPPWATWWAYGLYAVAIWALSGAFVRSQRRKIERERAINRRLREISDLKDEFLANTSHELQTPLYGVLGIAESLFDGAKGELSRAARSDLAMIIASARRLAGLVNDILDFSKLKRDRLELTTGPVDLKTLTDVVLVLSRPLAGAKDLRLVNAVTADLPAVEADENRLQQILYNLVGNAIKFTDSGFVEVSAERVAAADEERLAVKVTDTGIGIAEEHLKRIFEPFEQTDAAAERTFGGTGLGLAVTRQLVALHGGRIWARSSPGLGSTFHFTLPVARGEKAAPARPSRDLVARLRPPEVLTDEPGSELEETWAENREQARILIVDDDPVNRRVLVNHLSARGYRVRQASSGPEALRFLDRHRSDLVILDVMMPRMSGFEVCKKLRERHPPEELPVLLLTARHQVSDLLAGLASGANDFLTKPISKDELLARVETHLDLHFSHRNMMRLIEEKTAQLGERERLIGELEAKNEELERFNYTVSHDLRNPLVTIKSFLGLVRQDATRGDVERLAADLRHIEAAADQMQRLLQELLELSRIGHVLSPSEDVALGELAREVARLMSAEIDQRGVEVVIRNGLPVVRGDRIRLLQIFQNLFENAVKFMGDANRPRIEVGARTEGSETVIFVRDNGAGIDARYHDRIFGLFDRLDPVVPGTGVGLFLVRRIVELHGGRVWVESDGPGTGSTFCFTLGQRPDEEPAGSPEMTARHAQSSPAAS